MLGDRIPFDTTADQESLARPEDRGGDAGSMDHGTTADQETLGSGLNRRGGLPRGDEVLKAGLKAALFQTVQEPTRIGRFLLIERVGVGAMGEVYAAYDDRLDRKVALKLVRRDRIEDAGRNAADAMISQRLLREAQVLARLSHPNVVQVYEAGVFGDRVFLAMELIDGQTLSKWLKESELPALTRWRTVLDMFMAAGRGLEAAHAAGLVHRDFKPDNVLVGADGRVCVADFGLARATLEGATLDMTSDVVTRDEQGPRSGRPGDGQRRMHDFTESRTILGTPGYMSPEQMLGDPSDSRSDQFSFCVALYEALYGVRPFAAKDLDELKGRVVTGAYTEPPRDAAVPAWIWKIIARGLAVDPEARHASMSALLAALGRDPAQRRRRYLVAGLILGAGGLVGGGIVSQAWLASSADPCALAGSAVAWSPAVAEQVRAAFVATNVAYAGAAWDLVRERLDGYAGALGAERKATCEATHVRHEQPEDLFRLKTLCLDRGERHLDALVDALGQADASTVEHSARMVAGLPRIEVCRDGEALVLGVQPPEDATLAAAVQDVRARLARVHVQHAAGHHQQAQRLAEEALVAAEPLAYPPVRAEALHALGVVLGDGATAADIARAEEVLLEAVDLAESQRSDELVSEIWLALVLLANRHHQDLAGAHQWARRALATSQRLPAGGEQRARALGLLGGLHFLEGDHALAERRLLEAVAVAEQSGASRLALADLWHRLGNTRKAMARFDEARAAFEQALALRRAELGDSHPHLVRVLHDFGGLLRDTGELDRARALLEQALRLWTDTQGPESIDAADGHLSLVLLELEAGNLDQAGAHAQRARDILVAVAPDSRGRARAEMRHGLVAFRKRHFEDALAAFERAVAIDRARGALPRSIALGLSNVAEAQAELGRFDRALDTVAEAEALLAGEKDVPAVVRAMPHKARGLALLGRGDALAAAEALEQASTLLASEPGNLLEKADVQWALARALGAAGQGHAAREQATSAHRIYEGRGALGAAMNEDIERWLARTARH